MTKDFGGGWMAVPALRGVTLRIGTGTFAAVMGPSGSGKTTLLHCAAGLDRVTSGGVRLCGQELAGLSEAKLTALRRERIGFVFQSFNLLPALTVRENVGLPLRLAGRRPSGGEVRAVLDSVGLADRARHRPHQLSGGQQQRVAIARAIISRPDVFLADGRLVGTLERPTAESAAERMTQLTSTVLADVPDRPTRLAVSRGHLHASFVSILAGALLVMACGGIPETGVRADIDPEPVPVEPALADRLTDVDGVADVIADVSFPAALLVDGAPVSSATPPLGHGWTAASLTP